MGCAFQIAQRQCYLVNAFFLLRVVVEISLIPAHLIARNHQQSPAYFFSASCTMAAPATCVMRNVDQRLDIFAASAATMRQITHFPGHTEKSFP